MRARPALTIPAVAVLVVAAAGGLFAAASTLAQGGADAPATPSPGEQRAQLAAANQAVRTAQARARALQASAADARDEAQRAKTHEAAIAASIQAAEAQIVAAGMQTKLIDQQLGSQRSRLAQRQAPVARLIAALQSLARRPALLGLVQPGSTTDIVHVRAVLGAVTPEIRARTSDIRTEIARTRQLRSAAQAAVQRLADGRANLQRERLALVQMEAQHRLKSVGYRREAMFESDRALALGEQARDLVGLMDTMDEAAQTRASLAQLPGPLPRADSATDGTPDVTPADITPTGTSPANVTPAMRRPPPYRLPVMGRVVTGLGEVSDTGVRARGMTLVTWPGAQIVAPTSGRVMYAGRFRRYGNIVILDHGAGWTSLVSGLDRVGVRVGDQVVQGAPIGRAPQNGQQNQLPQVTIELRRNGRPVDLAQLLD